MKFSHVIWDWNGTLFDDVHLCVDIINGLLERRNLKKLSLEEYHDVFTFPVKEYYSKLFDFNKESFEVLGKEWMNIYEERKDSCTLADGAYQLVSDLYQSGIKQYVLSAYSLHTLKKLLDEYGLTQYLESIKGLDNIYAHSKMELGLELIKEIGDDTDKIVMIGDTLHDAEVAHNMGIEAILIAGGHQSEEKLRSNGNLVVGSFNELRKVLFV
ncbi:MAG: HAD family hydrolase [Ignavibacteria bacterium]|nr:MAG: HAD family hydrolase [Ignavibacteria bacterium]